MEVGSYLLDWSVKANPRPPRQPRRLDRANLLPPLLPVLPPKQAPSAHRRP